MQFGKVSFFTDRNWGFIIEPNGTKIYVNGNNIRKGHSIKDGNLLKEGDLVRYRVRKKAVDVELISPILSKNSDINLDKNIEKQYN